MFQFYIVLFVCLYVHSAHVCLSACGSQRTTLDIVYLFFFVLWDMFFILEPTQLGYLCLPSARIANGHSYLTLFSVFWE